jgi:hypothetical protein
LKLRVKGVNAGGTGTASAFVSVTTTATPVLMLDGLTALSSAGAYSFARKFRAAYFGSAFEVRRTDNSTLNIGFDANNDVDVAALLAFTGSTSAWVTKIYDQSGNAKDAVQASTGNQAEIVNAGAAVTVKDASRRRSTARPPSIRSLAAWASTQPAQLLYSCGEGLRCSGPAACRGRQHALSQPVHAAVQGRFAWRDRSLLHPERRCKTARFLQQRAHGVRQHQRAPDHDG